MKAASNDNSTRCLTEGEECYVYICCFAYSTKEDCAYYIMHADRRTTIYYTSESQSEIDPQLVAFQDEFFLHVQT